MYDCTAINCIVKQYPHVTPSHLQELPLITGMTNISHHDADHHQPLWFQQQQNKDSFFTCMYKVLTLLHMLQSHIYIKHFTASSLLVGSALTVTFIIRNIKTESKMFLALIQETPFDTALFWLGISNDKIWVDTPKENWLQWELS